MKRLIPLTKLTLSCTLLFAALGSPALAQIEVEEGAVYTGDIDISGDENGVNLETLDNDCGTVIRQRDDNDDGTPGPDNNLVVNAGEDAFEGNGTGCANSSSSSVGNSSNNQNSQTINANPTNISESGAITSGDATSSVDGGYSQSSSDVNGGNSTSQAEGATGGSSTSGANLGDVSRGETSLGDAIRGETSLGDATRGETSLGDATRGDTSLGNVNRGNTALGDNQFNTSTSGGTANQSQSANTTGGNVTAGSATQNQSANTTGGDVTGGAANTNGGSSDTTGGTVTTNGGSANQSASTTGGTANQSQIANTGSGPASTNSGDLSLAPITVQTGDNSVNNRQITNNTANFSNTSAFANNSVFGKNAFNGSVSGGMYARLNASSKSSSAYNNSFSHNRAEVEVGIFKAFQTVASKNSARRKRVKFGQDMIVYCVDFLKHYPNLMAIDVATIHNSHLKKTVQACQELGPLVAQQQPRQVIINVPPQAQPSPEVLNLPGSRDLPSEPRRITRSSGG
ncbi:hypothetical protein HRE53_15725 [Acaryochloris sp. 'Moss Beach']|uniref:hypothetical protein n=1 Tax=Acaryochloris sp. 'Moss Beach' TaxID=2740837 RepID=UPI001F3C1B18|nr:hypothetical protein [Acaryochloris sp. 'Moss Beach']UJB68056.1 hypothetical protein HRE53_15725 [Acaryochloris sp. 'Moss Beach']